MLDINWKFLAISFMAGSLCLSQFAQAQFPNGVRYEDDIVLYAPRELQRFLNEGQKAIQEQRYADAIESLGVLFAEPEQVALDSVQGQDFFLKPDSPPTNELPRVGHYTKTLKGVALRLLASLPPKGRELLEIEFGVKARQLLDDALEKRDATAIAAVARKYPFTDAGYDAQLLVATRLLRNGEPLGAAAKFQALLDCEAARGRFGVELAKAAAMSWLAGGKPDVAAKCLEAVVPLFPGMSIELGGQQIAFSAEQDWSALVASAASTRSAESYVPIADSWLTAGGSRSRNAAVDVSMPISTPNWVAKTHGSISEKKALDGIADTQFSENRALLPKASVRAIGDLILTKTTDARILALDLQTGLIRWVYYENGAPADLLSNTINPLARPNTTMGSSVSSELQNRVWGSSAFGQFSCDEERLYYVSEGHLARAAPQSRIQMYRLSKANQLHASSLEDEGFVLWIIGTPNEDSTAQLTHEELKGAFFLGPPLSHEGSLYCIVEIRGEIRLFAINPETGGVQWSQHICNPSFRQSDQVRKNQAISPTIVDGLIICPTGGQAIAAVDLETRDLRWLVTYPSAGRQIARNQPFGGSFGVSSNTQPLTAAWNDNAMIAEDGYVALSSIEKDILFVLNAFSGDVVLNLPRRDARYVAGIREGNIYLVCEKQAKCVEIETGAELWATSFPDGRLLAGTGLWQPDRLLIPLSENHLIHVSLEDGKVIEDCKVDRPVGNLFAHRGNLISCSSTTVSAFATRKQLEESVKSRLAADDRDPIALNQKAQLLFASGDIEDSFATLRSSYDIDSENVDTRSLLIEVLLAALEKDYAKYESAAEELSELVRDDPNGSKFLQLQALGSIEAGNQLDAFQNLLAFMRERLQQNRELSTTPNKYMDLSDAHSVHTDSWIAVQLARCYEAATDVEKQEMAAEINRELAGLSDLVLSQRRLLLRYFAWHPEANSKVIATALALGRSQAQEDTEQTSIERLLLPLLYSSDDGTSEVALKLLGRKTQTDINRFGPQGPILGSLYNYDASPTPNEQSLDPSVTFMDKVKWKTGRILDSTSQRGLLYPSGIRLNSNSERFGRPDIEVRIAGSEIVLCNMNGQTVSRIRYGRTYDANSKLNRARIVGGLLLVETAAELIALDIYRATSNHNDAIIWRHSLVTSVSVPTAQYKQPGSRPKDTSFGWPIPQRGATGKPSMVGPMTPSGILIHRENQVYCLDPYSGHRVWTRRGYGENVSFAVDEFSVALVDKSLGRIEIVDCRDGLEDQSKRDTVENDWEHWFSAGSLVVDYKEPDSGTTSGIATKRPQFKIWNPFTGDVFAEFLDLKAESRAAMHSERYLVIADKSDQLHYLDLVAQTKQAWSQPIDDDLNSIRLVQVDDKLVVLSSQQKRPKEIELLAKRNNVTPDLLEIHGSVYCIDLNSGNFAWNRPAKLYGMYFNVNQPRNCPFLVSYRFNPNETCAVTLLDVRDGKFATTVPDFRVSRSGGFAMEVKPRTQTLELTLGSRLLMLECTDLPQPPRPVARYGYIPERESSMTLDIDAFLN